MDEEEMLKRISRMLEIGGTMLAEHHECGAPLFRYKGKVLCPVCSTGAASEEPAEVEELSEGRLNEKTYPSSREAARVDEAAAPEETIEHGEPFNAVRRSLCIKLNELSQSISEEQDLARLKTKLECIEIAVRALKLL